MAQCCLCTGDLILLGQLGRTKQYRCRQCGMIFSAVRRVKRTGIQDQSENRDAESQVAKPQVAKPQVAKPQVAKPQTSNTQHAAQKTQRTREENSTDGS